MGNNEGNLEILVGKMKCRKRKRKRKSGKNRWRGGQSGRENTSVGGEES